MNTCNLKNDVKFYNITLKLIKNKATELKITILLCIFSIFPSHQPYPDAIP